MKLRREDVEPGSVLGYVLDVGDHLFLVAVVSDLIRYNGFQVFRQRDVTNIDVPHEHTEFVERALSLRSESRPHTPPVDLSSTRSVIETASRCAPLITIHREIDDPGVCHIGRTLKVTDTHVELHEIDCDARWWEHGTDQYALSEVTRIDFGGDYERALALVNGTL